MTPANTLYSSELTRSKGGGLRFGVLVRLMQATEDLSLIVSLCQLVFDHKKTSAKAKSNPLFVSLLSGIRHFLAMQNAVVLQSAVLTLVNTLISTAEELDLRVHLRNEIYNCGARGKGNHQSEPSFLF